MYTVVQFQTISSANVDILLYLVFTTQMIHNDSLNIHVKSCVAKIQNKFKHERV